MVWASNTAPATRTASTPSSPALAAIRSTVFNRAWASAGPSSGPNLSYWRPICQSAVCRKRGMSSPHPGAVPRIENERGLEKGPLPQRSVELYSANPARHMLVGVKHRADAGHQGPASRQDLDASRIQVNHAVTVQLPEH